MMNFLASLIGTMVLLILVMFGCVALLSGCIPMMIGGLATYAVMDNEDDNDREALQAACSAGNQDACTALSVKVTQ